MNSPLVDARSESSGGSGSEGRTTRITRRIEELYLKILDRRPDAGEIDEGLTYIQSLRRKWNDIDEEKAWQSFCHALMASNEFIYVY